MEKKREEKPSVCGGSKLRSLPHGEECSPPSALGTPVLKCLQSGQQAQDTQKAESELRRCDQPFQTKLEGLHHAVQSSRGL